MCIDAPESGTISLSSGLRIDGAGGHQFSDGQKNAALFVSFSFRILLAQLSRCFTGTSVLAIPSFLETDPQILED